MLRPMVGRGALVIALALAGCMRRGAVPSAPPPAGTATVRYQVRDLERSVAFYTQRLGFETEKRTGTVFAVVSHGDLRLLLSAPGSAGARPMPDGRTQGPGGWNRIVLYVDDLASSVRALEAGGVRLRNAIEVVPGGKQVLVEDPDGNPIELHERAPDEPVEERRRPSYRKP
jgi:catechol 2,3-dioxygenase-like lactoylglutathione lyase family enzyme